MARDPKSDPYAALKQAHKAGKVIQYNCGSDAEPEWEDISDPEFGDGVNSYRVKPSTPPFQLPPPPPGMQWHREDGWTPEMLPRGYRPRVLGETGVYEVSFGKGLSWEKGYDESSPANKTTSLFWRTTRPLTFTHEGKTWTWHRPGDPMPCDGEKVVHALYKTSLRISNPQNAAWFAWTDIIGWRYADEPKSQVPLGPEDILPGSVVRRLQNRSAEWNMVAAIAQEGLKTSPTNYSTWEALKNEYEINRSLPLTGKWNPDAWGPCHKPG